MNKVSQKTIDNVLTGYYWPENLKPEKLYSRMHDDTDGEISGIISVYIDRMGDAYVSIDGTEALRFRTFGGGGRSLKVRNALVLLAEAIRQEEV